MNRFVIFSTGLFLIPGKNSFAWLFSYRHYQCQHYYYYYHCHHTNQNSQSIHGELHRIINLNSTNLDYNRTTLTQLLTAQTINLLLH